MPPNAALPAHAIDAAEPDAVPDFSVCTLVTDSAQYAAMTESFAAGGFTPGRAEFRYLDNRRGNRWDGFAGIARLIGAARGRYILLCHQDLRLLDHDATVLAARLAELDERAPDWGIAGNAGGTAAGGLAIRISDPHGADQNSGSLPARVVSLDENFLVLRRDAPIGLSHDLSGFHLYGTDLCMQAALAGRSAWVINFHLRHLSGGRKDGSFLDAQARFERKYAGLLRNPADIRTPVTRLRFGAGVFGAMLAAWRLRRRRARLGRG